MAATFPLSFQDLILELHAYWRDQGCLILQPYDLEVGAGTLHPATVLKALGPDPWRVAYVQPCRRPADGRYGENPNRMRLFHQYQVLLKPDPPEMMDLYLDSLRHVGLDLEAHDIRFVEDDWENPTVGAAGLGWEVWCDGMEITQYTYFQQVGGLPVSPVSGELTYGLERLALYLQGVDSVFDLAFNDPKSPQHRSYGDVFLESERQFSAYEQEEADVDLLRRQFDETEAEARRLIDRPGRNSGALVLPAFDLVLKASHLFNLLDARGAVAVAERHGYIGRVRELAKACAVAWDESASRS